MSINVHKTIDGRQNDMNQKIVAIDKELISFLASIGVEKADLVDIADHGMSLEVFVERLRIIQEGVSIVPVVRPLTKDDVISLNESPEASSEGMEISKFTPSSGAASRMFAPLVETLKSLREGNSVPEKHEVFVFNFLMGLQNKSEHKFSFLDELGYLLLEKKGIDLQALIAEIDSAQNIEGGIKTILEYVLEEKGLNYSNKPKALIAFHTDVYGRPVTALEEQMIDAVMYGQSKLHLTISEEHRSWYEEVVADIKSNNNALQDVDIKFSVQETSTDSPGLGVDGKIFRGTDGKVKFFPAGHGSLVNNLLNTPTCMIRNIDNVPNPKASKEAIYNSHQKMAGVLAYFNKNLNKIFQDLSYQRISGDKAESKLLELVNKYKLNLFMNFEEFSAANDNKKIDMLMHTLNRPFRVLGVVKNQGEPGGGPFYVTVDFIPTVSIVEKDELRTQEQVDMMDEGDFFNPVDIAFSAIDIHGEAFSDLTPFVDTGRSFVVEKTDKQSGRTVRRMEHPGLWNGGMGKVNSVTVELPIETFGPVKVVNDLTGKPQHNTN